MSRGACEEQFEEIIVKMGDQEQLVYLRDVVRDKKLDDAGRVIQKGIEVGAKNNDVNSYLNNQPSVTLALVQLPGSNALDTADAVRAKMEELKKRFPPGVEYKIVYDTTVFINESIHGVYKTLYEAFILVFLVVLIFLQDWRATLMPMIDVPVSLIGTFAVMAGVGFSLNNLTLFGLVLAIGIVVDDAISSIGFRRAQAFAIEKPLPKLAKVVLIASGAALALTLVANFRQILDFVSIQPGSLSR